MLEYYRVAVEIAHAQSKLRPLDNDGLLRLIGNIYGNITSLLVGSVDRTTQALPPSQASRADEAHKSIRPKSIICLECGRAFRALTKPHLATHGLDAVTYREKWGLHKNIPLACHELCHTRRRTMEGLQLWKSNSLRRLQSVQSAALGPGERDMG